MASQTLGYATLAGITIAPATVTVMEGGTATFITGSTNPDYTFHEFRIARPNTSVDRQYAYTINYWNSTIGAATGATAVPVDRSLTISGLKKIHNGTHVLAVFWYNKEPQQGWAGAGYSSVAATLNVQSNDDGGGDGGGTGGCGTGGGGCDAGAGAAASLILALGALFAVKRKW